MITGWLADEDCPDCGGPLLETSTEPEFLTLECPGCGYRITWNVTEHGDRPDTDPADPGEQEI